MALSELLLKNLGYRRLYQDVNKPGDELKTMVENVRFTPSGGNKKPLKFILLSATGKMNWKSPSLSPWENRKKK